MDHKGPRVNAIIPLLSKSPPNYLQKVGQHTKPYRGEMVVAVTAAATVPCAKRQHDHCAAPDFPSFVQTP